MDPGEPSHYSPFQMQSAVNAHSQFRPRAGPKRFLHTRDVHLYKLCEDLSECLIYALLIFSPWAFGTTEPWSIWTMNAGSYLLGALLLWKLVIRLSKGYRPPRWVAMTEGNRAPAHSRFTRVLAVLTLALLAYCLVSAINASSTYHPRELSFTYHRHVPWLPHSLDSTRTWNAFFQLAGLACVFWAVRDWLLGKTVGEERAARGGSTDKSSGAAAFLPARLRRLLWVLAINGALLGIEAILQRLEGSGNLLFLVKPRVNPGAEAQFGPWAYRANAAQYFNLLWPVCLGFWWTLHRSGGFKRRTHHLLLLAGIIMAACPIISTSRGGALVMAGLVISAGFFLLLAHSLLLAHKQQDRRTRRFTLVVVLLFFSAAIAAGYWLGWKPLKPRLAQIGEGFVLREEMYANARPMADDYPLFGTGPGTFEYVFQLYRISTSTYWPAQLHNDWLETRITFGLLGGCLLAACLIVVIFRWFAPGGIHGGRRFTLLMWLAIAGCLVHARFDFPFQIHSILFLFTLVCAVLFNLSRRPR